MPQTPNQQRAADRVASWLASNEKNPAWLVDATGADPGTIGDFLNGHRWPKVGTQGKIERALGWPAGCIRQIGNGSDPDEVGAVLAGASLTANQQSSLRQHVLDSDQPDYIKRAMLALLDGPTLGEGDPGQARRTG